MIEHEGIVKEICRDHIKIEIKKKDACGVCHSKNFCSLSQTTHKIVEIKNANLAYQVGDKVTVIMEQSSGYMALFLGYIVPFFIIIIFLFFFLRITQNEGLSVFLVLLSVMVYYGTLYVLREKLKTIFSLKIKE